MPRDFGSVVTPPMQTWNRVTMEIHPSRAEPSWYSLTAMLESLLSHSFRHSNNQLVRSTKITGWWTECSADYNQTKDKHQGAKTTISYKLLLWMSTTYFLLMGSRFPPKTTKTANDNMSRRCWCLTMKYSVRTEGHSGSMKEEDWKIVSCRNKKREAAGSTAEFIICVYYVFSF